MGVNGRLMSNHLFTFNFRFQFNAYCVTILAFLPFLPWSVGTFTFPCDDGGKFDSIHCTHKNKLILTLGDNYFEGDCSDYPFIVHQEGHSISSRKTSIIASVMDNFDVIYFFERNRVIIHDGPRRFERSIGEVFNKFEGSLVHVAAIPNPPNLDFKISYLITLYNDKEIFYYHERELNLGLPYWTRENDLTDLGHLQKVNKTIPPVRYLIGVSYIGGSYIFAKAILGPDANHENLTYYTALIDNCGFPAYKYNLIDCLEENDWMKLNSVQGQLVRCPPNYRTGLNLMTVMLWGCCFLIILGTLGLLKCILISSFKKLRRSKRKVRFQEDGHKGDPKKHIIFNYGIENPHRMQSYGLDSMAQSAVSINDEYKDIDYSSDLEEEKITLQDSDLKPPLEQTQST